MRIRDVMTKNPITVDSETLVMDAQRMMKENNIRRLPVVDKGNLVGIVTQHDLLQASPSPATSLSIHELNYLLARMKVKEIMKKRARLHEDESEKKDEGKRKELMRLFDIEMSVERFLTDYI